MSKITGTVLFYSNLTLIENKFIIFSPKNYSLYAMFTILFASNNLHFFEES